LKRNRWLVASLCWFGMVVSPIAQAGPLPFADLMQRPSVTPSKMNLWTSWGFGQRENAFNELIASSVASCWQDPRVALPPSLYKALMAVESSFNPQAVSRAGARGLTQLMPDTARRFGLRVDECLDPHKAVPAGIQAFQEKCKVVLEPGNYPKLMGQPASAMPWSVTVAHYYDTQGMPEGDDLWHLGLGAYNGGGGTILRAMAYAIEAQLDPRKWDNLAGAPGKAVNSPLHRACCDVYGPGGGQRKVQELAAYPRKIMNLYRSTLAFDQQPGL